MISPAWSSASRRSSIILVAIAAWSALSATVPAQNLPEQHFSVDKPADLLPEEAEVIYKQVIDDMVDAYALSREPIAINYRRWQRFNDAPYPAATHGSRYVNNYGNGPARVYTSFEPGDAMPEGAIIVKDSFAVTTDGDVFLGPLFVMEKMADGFDPTAQDWRYSMIMPDGSFFGMTGGDNDQRVRFCVTCHETAGAENDHLFFVPEGYRIGDR